MTQRVLSGYIERRPQRLFALVLQELVLPFMDISRATVSFLAMQWPPTLSDLPHSPDAGETMLRDCWRLEMSNSHALSSRTQKIASLVCAKDMHHTYYPIHVSKPHAQSTVEVLWGKRKSQFYNSEGRISQFQLYHCVCLKLEDARVVNSPRYQSIFEVCLCLRSGGQYLKTNTYNCSFYDVD